jgi:hypothetical protein
MKRTLLLATLFAVHAAITVRALMDRSYLGLFAFAFEGWPARQIFSDLTVGMLLITSWMLSDAKRTGRKAWPYVLATVAVGSFGPLAYLLVGAIRKQQPRNEAAAGRLSAGA